MPGRYESIFVLAGDRLAAEAFAASKGFRHQHVAHIESVKDVRRFAHGWTLWVLPCARHRLDFDEIMAAAMPRFLIERVGETANG